MNFRKDKPSVGVTFCGLAAVVAFLAVAMVLPNLMRAREGSPPSCINNLRIIESAEEQWALEYNKTNAEVPRWEDILPYLGRGGGVMLKCPKGGIYNLQRVGAHPTCTFPGHVLP